ncbi:MAG: DUF5658 family protein [Methanoregulaceae archaeon]|nr:DUF5658 family protein [Methanoregulaceae archaeon]
MAEQVPEPVMCQPGNDPSEAAGGPDRLSDYFIPVTGKNYFLWPLLFLIPLMIMDAFSTTFALSLGHVEKNPVVAGIAMNPPLHLGLKILISVILLFLCIFLYRKEVAHEGRCPPKFFTLNLIIFIALLLDCYVYAFSVVNNISLLFT